MINRNKVFYHFKDREFTMRDLALYLKKQNGRRVIKATLYKEYCKLSKFKWNYEVMKNTGLPDDIVFKILTDF